MKHWREYLIEAAGLGLFMISACSFGVLLWYPGSPVAQLISDRYMRRMLMGIAMGLTAISIVYSPWGKRSGAHINPSTTLMFLRLGKVAKTDAFAYMLAQFSGAISGVVIAAMIFGTRLMQPPVQYVITQPGMSIPLAFVAEVIISFILMTTVLNISNSRKLNRYTGLFAGLLVATYITLEAPISGMSMNPARTFGSALPAFHFQSLWIYFLAPPIGMLLAAEMFVRIKGIRAVLCAKYHHDNDQPCIFNCNYFAKDF